MYGKLLSFLRDHRTRTHYYNFSDNSNTLRSRDLTVFAYCVARGMEYVQNKQVRKLFCILTYFRFSNKPGYSPPVKKKGICLLLSFSVVIPRNMKEDISFLKQPYLMNIWYHIQIMHWVLKYFIFSSRYRIWLEICCIYLTIEIIYEVITSLSRLDLVTVRLTPNWIWNF